MGRGQQRRLLVLESKQRELTRLAVDTAARERVIEKVAEPPSLGPVRTCGPCSLCCKVMAVPTLAKPRGQWCPHAKHKAGCRCYSERPTECQAFECLWLQGAGPDDARPDRLHAVLTPTSDGKGLVVHEDPGWRGHATIRLRTFINSLVQDKGATVIIACGESRRLLKAGTDVTFPDGPEAPGVRVAQLGDEQLVEHTEPTDGQEQVEG